MKLPLFVTAGTITLLLAACTGVQPEASYPTRPSGAGGEIVYSDQRRDTIFGEGQTIGSTLFGRGNRDDQAAGASGIGVNSFLWRAALDTVAFMPVSSADPFGGVILTDWYENPDAPGERFKMNVMILDQQLRSDGIKVSVFKQTAGNNGWRDAAVPNDMALQIENAILTRARELRVQQQSAR